MSTSLWLLYAFSLLLVWYEKQGIVQGIPFKPPILCRRYLAVFWIFRLAVTFASLIGLWRFYSVTVAVVGLIGYFVVRTVSLHYYFHRECLIWVEQYRRREIEKAEKACTVVDKFELSKNAAAFAKSVVAQNLKE
jgi:hypothetical protein